VADPSRKKCIKKPKCGKDRSRGDLVKKYALN